MKRPYTEQAKTFVNAIKTIADKPENLDNLENYLSIHFQKWLATWATTPDGIAEELEAFASL